MTKTFFINVAPSNDRRDEKRFHSQLDHYVGKTKKEFFKYTLITAGDKRLDPWVVAQRAMEKNPEFHPLIAVNPLHQHPFHIVKKLASLQDFYARPMALNMIPGSFPNEMSALHDELSFAERFSRLKDFSNVLKDFFKEKTTGSFQGQYYQVTDAKLFPPLKEDVELFYSGVATTAELSGNYVKGIKPLSEMKKSEGKAQGLLLGICARATNEEAQASMLKLYPQDRKGQMLFDMVLGGHETSWSQWMKDYLQRTPEERDDFNLIAMKNFWTSAPFIVGSYDECAGLLKKYSDYGYEFFITDFHHEDFLHVEECIKRFRKL